jgi:hypothetical protein
MKRYFKIIKRGDFTGSAGGPNLSGMVLELAFEGCPYKTDWIWLLQPEFDINGRKYVYPIGTVAMNPDCVEEIFQK